MNAGQIGGMCGHGSRDLSKILAANERTRDETNLRIYRCPDISQSNRVRLSRIGVDRLMYWVAEVDNGLDASPWVGIQAVSPSHDG